MSLGSVAICLQSCLKLAAYLSASAFVCHSVHFFLFQLRLQLPPLPLQPLPPPQSSRNLPVQVDQVEEVRSVDVAWLMGWGPSFPLTCHLVFHLTTTTASICCMAEVLSFHFVFLFPAIESVMFHFHLHVGNRYRPSVLCESMGLKSCSTYYYVYAYNVSIFCWTFSFVNLLSLVFRWAFHWDLDNVLLLGT